MTAVTSPSSRRAWVVLITKAAYLQGLLVVHRKLKELGTVYPFVAMVTPNVGQAVRDCLEHAGIIVRQVDPLKPEDGTHALNEHDTRFEDTWTKLRSFGLTEYDRVVHLDCDMLVLKNMDDLFDLDVPADSIAACHACACNPHKLAHYPSDWTPKNCAYSAMSLPSALAYPPIQITPGSPRPHNLLNSGLVILHPNEQLLAALVRFLKTDPRVPSFSFPDQDLYAAFFKDRWIPLPYVYNSLKTLRVIHQNIWRDEDVRNVHYILDKPWQAPRGKPPPNSADESTALLHEWWSAAYEEMLAEMKQDPKSGWALVDKYVKRD